MVNLKNKINTKLIALAFLLLMTSVATYALKPKDKIAKGIEINLETMIPESFGEWTIDKTIVPLQVDPQRLALINKLYNQTLTRTYINSQNQRVMLSIAYGGDQSDSMQVHRPEVCYPAQGFTVEKIYNTRISTGYGDIPVRRLFTTMQTRLEPITYWITIGDKVEVSGFKWKLKQLSYGLTGKIPDGMLFRVSTISGEQEGYIIQQKFIEDLIKFLNPKDRQKLIGLTTS